MIVIIDLIVDVNRVQNICLYMCTSEYNAG